MKIGEISALPSIGSAQQVILQFSDQLLILSSSFFSDEIRRCRFSSLRLDPLLAIRSSWNENTIDYPTGLHRLHRLGQPTNKLRREETLPCHRERETLSDLKDSLRSLISSFGLLKINTINRSFRSSQSSCFSPLNSFPTSLSRSLSRFWNTKAILSMNNYGIC